MAAASEITVGEFLRVYSSVKLCYLHALLGGILKRVSFWIFSGYRKAKFAFSEKPPCSEK